jgi:hypothetical protein
METEIEIKIKKTEQRLKEVPNVVNQSLFNLSYWYNH